jgi:hypothetical protein
MSLRKVGTFFNQITDKKADVYRDSEWQEFRVKFYVRGQYQKNADMHTDDRRDADFTASEWVNRESN